MSTNRRSSASLQSSTPANEPHSTDTIQATLEEWWADDIMATSSTSPASSLYLSSHDDALYGSFATLFETSSEECFSNQSPLAFVTPESVASSSDTAYWNTSSTDFADMLFDNNENMYMPLSPSPNTAIVNTKSLALPQTTEHHHCPGCRCKDYPRATSLNGRLGKRPKNVNAEQTGNAGVAQMPTTANHPGPPSPPSIKKAHSCGCGQRFRYPKDLFRHQLVHNEERQHCCPHDDCDYSFKGFKRSDNLARHVKNIHRGD